MPTYLVAKVNTVSTHVVEIEDSQTLVDTINQKTPIVQNGTNIRIPDGAKVTIDTGRDFWELDADDCRISIQWETRTKEPR